MPRKELSAVPQTIGPYLVEGVLGQGGMGVVYRARHQGTGELVAVKAVQMPDKEILQSLRREVAALARVRHPGVVRIVMEGVQDGLPWYAMELLDGLTLQQWAAALSNDVDSRTLDTTSLELRPPPPSSPLAVDTPSWWTRTLDFDSKRSWQAELHGELDDFLSASWPPGREEHPIRSWGGRRLPIPAGSARQAVLSLIRRLCSALSFLHGEGIVHRDLKPDNVLVRFMDGASGNVRQPDRSPTPVLVDFGLMTQVAGDVSREELDLGGVAAGTIAFIAPEQLRGELVDARADLYSLGCILFTLLTGRHVFVGSTLGEIARAHLELTPVAPSSLVPDLSPELDALILRLLAKKPRERLGHADDVAAALARLGATDSPVQSAPIPRSYLYRPRMAGRELPLHTLEKRVGQLQESRGGILLVGGESGVGKTRLVMEAARRAERLDIFVLAGQCLPRSGPGLEGTAGALHPLRRPLQTLADRCRERGPEETERLFGRRIRVLGQYAPELDGLPAEQTYPEPAELPAEAARLRLFTYLSQTFAAISQEHSDGEVHSNPTVLLLDDLQWADDLTLGFLLHIAQLGIFERLPILMLGTYRTEEVVAHGSTALQGLLELVGARRVELGRLDEASVGAMVGDMLAIERPPTGFVRFLTRQSEGNPFFVAEYLRAALQEGLLGRDSQGHWQVMAEAATGSSPATTDQYEALPLPRSLRALVERRLVGLPELARRLVAAAAVAGREATVELVAELADISEARILDILSELIGRQVLETSWGGRVRFAHDKIREVAYGGIAPGVRATLHRSAALVLEKREGPSRDEALAVLGDHWREAGEAARARPFYLAAARRALGVYAHAEAERLYRAFLALADVDSPETPLVRLELASRVLAIHGRSDEALDQCRTALEEAERLGDTGAQGAAYLQIGGLTFHAGRLGEAAGLFERALELHRQAGNRRAEGDALDNLANTFWLDGRQSEASVLFERALAIHREVTNRRSEGDTLNNLAGVAWQQGDMDRTRALGEEARRIFHELGDRRQEGTTLSNLAGFYHAIGHPEDAERLFEQALALHREVGDRRSEAHTLSEIARLQRRARGAFDRATGFLNDAEPMARDSGLFLIAALCLCERGHLELAQGGSGRTILDEARELVSVRANSATGPLGEALEGLRRAVEADEQGRALFRGECIEDLPEGLRLWLIRTRQL